MATSADDTYKNSGEDLTGEQIWIEQDRILADLKTLEGSTIKVMKDFRKSLKSFSASSLNLLRDQHKLPGRLVKSYKTVGNKRKRHEPEECYRDCTDYTEHTCSILNVVEPGKQLQFMFAVESAAQKLKQFHRNVLDFAEADSLRCLESIRAKQETLAELVALMKDSLKHQPSEVNTDHSSPGAEDSSAPPEPPAKNQKQTRVFVEGLQGFVEYELPNPGSPLDWQTSGPQKSRERLKC